MCAHSRVRSKCKDCKERRRTRDAAGTGVRCCIAAAARPCLTRAYGPASIDARMTAVIVLPHKTFFRKHVHTRAHTYLPKHTYKDTESHVLAHIFTVVFFVSARTNKRHHHLTHTYNHAHTHARTCMHMRTHANTQAHTSNEHPSTNIPT